MPPDQPLPFYQPPSIRERLQHMVSLPHRKGLCGKAKPMDIGLWSDDRNQLDWIDQQRSLDAEQRYRETQGREVV